MRIADWLIRWRYLVLVAMLGAWGGSAYLARGLQTNYSFWTLFVSDDPEVVRLRKHIDRWGDESSSVYVALRSEEGVITSPENLRLVAQLEERLADIDGVTGVRSVLSVVTVTGRGDVMHIGPLVESVPSTPEEADAFSKEAHTNRMVSGLLLSENNRTTLVSADIDRSLRDAAERNPVVGAIETTAEEVVGDAPLDVFVTGIPTAQVVYSTRMLRDLGVFTITSILLLSFTLFIMFRSIPGVVLPLMVVALATTATMATIVVTGDSLTMITTAIPTLMLVIGIADAVHLVAHFRQRLAAGDDRAAAVRSMVSKLGTACFLTSFTTAIGFASLVTASIATVRSFGIYAAIGIGFAFLANVILIPAGLAIWPPKAMTPKQAEGRLTCLLLRLGGWSLARPWGALGITGLVAAVSVWGMTRVDIDSRIFEEIADDDPVVLAHEKLEEDLPGVRAYALDIFAHEGVLSSPKALQMLDGLERKMEAHPAVDRALGIVEVIKEMNKATHGGDPAFDVVPDDPALVAQFLMLAEGEASERFMEADRSASQIIMRGPDVGGKVWEELRAQIEAEVDALEPDMEILVTGASSMATRALTYIVNDILTSLLGATVVILLVMSILLRSVKLGLLSMIPNLLPLLITVGFMGLVGINLRTSTVVIFSISLGLAVDDTIHFLVRYGREKAAGRDTHDAVIETLRTTGRPIVYTSILLVAGFWVLLLSSFNATRDVGLLGGVTLISALFADLFMLPALLRLVEGGTKEN